MSRRGLSIDHTLINVSKVSSLIQVTERSLPLKPEIFQIYPPYHQDPGDWRSKAPGCPVPTPEILLLLPHDKNLLLTSRILHISLVVQ